MGRLQFRAESHSPDARIPIVRTILSSSGIGVSPVTKVKNRGNGDRQDACPTIITPPEQVREKFQQVKKLKDVPQRGWVLDVLNIVRRVANSKFKIKNSKLPPDTFSNEDIYAFENELAALHPDNRNIRPKIRQQLQVLRDTGFLSQVERGHWQVK